MLEAWGGYIPGYGSLCKKKKKDEQSWVCCFQCLNPCVFRAATDSFKIEGDRLFWVKSAFHKVLYCAVITTVKTEIIFLNILLLGCLCMLYIACPGQM